MNMGKDSRARFKTLLAGDQDDPEIQYELGLCYLAGDGVKQSREQAELWLSRAASQGHTDAMAKMRELAAENQPPETPAFPPLEDEPYDSEEPVDQIPFAPGTGNLPPLTNATLPEWCARAEGGDPDVQYQVALYFQKNRVPGSREDVERYLTLSSDSGHPGACMELAHMRLTQGRDAEAVELLQGAAEQGMPVAIEQLAVCYSLGRGVRRDTQEAERLFAQAAELGGGEGMLNLAIRYATGDNLTRSQGKAMSWLKKAQDAGVRDARNRFDTGCEEVMIRRNREDVERARGDERVQGAEEAAMEDWHREQERRMQEQQRLQQEAERRRIAREEVRRRQEEEARRRQEEEEEAELLRQDEEALRARTLQARPSEQPDSTPEEDDTPGPAPEPQPERKKSKASKAGTDGDEDGDSEEGGRKKEKKDSTGPAGAIVCVLVLLVLVVAIATFAVRYMNQNPSGSASGSASGSVSSSASGSGSASTSQSTSDASSSEPPAPQVVDVDAFQSVEVSFTGMAPYGTAEVINSSEDAFLRGIEYIVEPDEGLSNGDMVTVTAVFDEDLAAEAGYRINVTELTYTVSGLTTYVTIPAEISSSAQEQLETQAEKLLEESISHASAPDILSSMGVDFSANSEFVFASGEFHLAETYLMTIKSGFTDSRTNIYGLVYAVPLTVVSGSETVLNEYGYYFVTFPNLTIDENGNVSVDLTQAKLESVNKDRNAVYQNYVEPLKDRYDVSQQGYSLPDVPAVNPSLFNSSGQSGTTTGTGDTSGAS